MDAVSLSVKYVQLVFSTLAHTTNFTWIDILTNLLSSWYKIVDANEAFTVNVKVKTHQTNEAELKLTDYHLSSAHNRTFEKHSFAKHLSVVVSDNILGHATNKNSST